MAITKGAKKAQRKSVTNKAVNDRRRLTLKKNVKAVVTSVIAKAASEAQAGLKMAYKALDKAAKGGVIKKGTADRKKSRLAKAVAKVAKIAK
jgi:small subunit ribosomal protein S20